MELAFAIKNIKSSNHPDFVDAIKLYLAHTKPDLRTDSKEIAHWLDVCNKRFPDPFYILGFYLNGRLIGFSELAYFAEERFAIVDYLVIDEDFREKGAFHVFLGQIKQFIRDTHPEYHYIVGEVGCHSGKEPSEDDRILIRLLKTVHFGVVKCIYRIPRMTAFESSMGAVMMIYADRKIKEIKKEAFLAIVNAVYYKYYLRWVSEFESENEKIKYTREVSELIKEVESKLKNKEVIEINGTPGYEANVNGEAKLRRGRTAKILAASFVFIVFSLLLGVVFWVLKVRAQMDTETVKTIIIFSIIAEVAAIYFYQNRSNGLSRLVEKLIDKI